MTPTLNIANRKIGEDHPTFVIAEIGQNHQGDINIAKKLIKIAQASGADCVKFQKTCLPEKFTGAALRRSYNNKNSWGETYVLHKEYLEFTNEEFLELQYYAKKLDILFTASAMDLVSLKFLQSIGVPFIKIGSGDFNNFLLIEEASKIGIPLVISTGMSNLKNVKKIYETVKSIHTNFALLHCVSSYPTPLEDLNLKVINLYTKEFPDIVIGYSGHELGIDYTLAAVAVGAQIIERHVTLDKKQKGSDHQSSLEPNELKTLINKIRLLETAMGSPLKNFQKSEQACYNKLGKSLVAAKSFKAGYQINKEDVKIKVSFPSGLDGCLLETVIGKTLKWNINEDEPITENMF